MTLKMTSTQVVKTSVANNSPSQDSGHPNDHFQSRYSKYNICPSLVFNKYKCKRSIHSSSPACDFTMANVNNQAKFHVKHVNFNTNSEKVAYFAKKTSYMQEKNPDDDTCTPRININKIAQNKNFTNRKNSCISRNPKFLA